MILVPSFSYNYITIISQSLCNFDPLCDQGKALKAHSVCLALGADHAPLEAERKPVLMHNRVVITGVTRFV